MLLDERADKEFTIHLTYPIGEMDIEREKNWHHEQNKEKNKKMEKPDTVVRKDWSHEEHSLTAFFDAHPDFFKKVSIVEDDTPHVIDLLEEVAF